MVRIRDNLTLKACRVIANIEAKELAKAVGVSVDTVYSWEKRRTHPNTPQIQKLIRFYADKGYIVEIHDINF